MAPAVKRTAAAKRKPAVKKTAAKRPAARKPAVKAGSRQALMSKELEALKRKHNYKTGATTNKVTWAFIFKKAAANVSAMS